MGFGGAETPQDRGREQAVENRQEKGVVRMSLAMVVEVRMTPYQGRD